MFLSLAPFTKQGILFIFKDDILTLLWWPFFKVKSEKYGLTLSILKYIFLRLIEKECPVRTYKEVSGLLMEEAVKSYVRDNFLHVQYGVIVGGNVRHSLLMQLDAFKTTNMQDVYDFQVISTKNTEDMRTLYNMLQEEGIVEQIYIFVR